MGSGGGSGSSLPLSAAHGTTSLAKHHRIAPSPMSISMSAEPPRTMYTAPSTSLATSCPPRKYKPLHEPLPGSDPVPLRTSAP